MKKQLSVLIALTILFVAMPQKVISQQRDYAEKWKQVEYYKSKKRPESALDMVLKIRKRAQKRNDYSQFLKTMMYQADLMLAKNNDQEEYQKVIKQFEKHAQSIKDTVAKSIAYHLIAQLYESYRHRYFYVINKRKELKDDMPKDLSEWTMNMFDAKIKVMTELSLKNKKILQNTDIYSYQILLDKDRINSDLMPTVFDFLVFYVIGINNNEKAKLYEEMIQCHQSKNRVSALIYWQLEKLNLVSRRKSKGYLKALNQLIEKYADNEFVVEVLATKTRYLVNQKKRKEAFDLIEKGIQKFPNYKRIDLLKNIKKEILHKQLRINSTKNYVCPNTEIDLMLISKNISKAKLLVYRSTLSAEKYTELTYKRKNEIIEQSWDLVEAKPLTIYKNSNFANDTTYIKIKTHSYGIYNYVVKDLSSKNAKVEKRMIVTDFVALKAKLNGKMDIFSLERKEGNPIKNTVVKIYEIDNYKNKFNFVKTIKTDKEGLAEFRKFSKKSNDYMFFFEKGKDIFYCDRNYLYSYTPNRDIYDNEKVTLFTDRSLYRPGQIVYFKGIAFNREKQKVIANKEYTVKLYDTRRKVVKEKTFTTNEFGSFAGSFILPQSGGLNGRYSLRVNRGFYYNFSVEEYKRPTFEVEIKKPEKEVRFSEQMIIKGAVHSYAGFPSSNAIVKYTISRTPHYLCWWMPYSNDKVVSEGTIKTNERGQFELPFTAQKEIDKEKQDEWWYRERGVFYTYSVVVNVTDTKGETQSAEQIFSVGDKSLFILSSLPERIDKEKLLKEKLQIKTINGENVDAKIKYEVIRLQMSKKYYEDISDKKKIKSLKTSLQGFFNSRDSLILDLRKKTPGAYKIRFTTKDNRGNLIVAEKYFILYSVSDKKMPIKQHTWLLPYKTLVKPSETAEIYFGTSHIGAFVLCEISKGNHVFERRWEKINNEIKKFKIPFKREYKNGVILSFTFVKNGRLFQKRVNITQQKENKIEQPFVSVFRNRLQPNSEEEWTVTIPNKKSKQSAELLISMYDASLDAIKEHHWSFYPSPQIPLLRSFNWGLGHCYLDGNHYYYYPIKKEFIPYFHLPKLIDWITPNYYLRGDSYTKYARVRNTNTAPMEEMNEAVVVGFANEQKATMTGTIATKKEKKKPKKQIKVKLRENFNETAFFYPQLRTDKQGNVKVQFTVPEALTRWNVNLLSHTKNLYYGQNKLQVVTQKDLMVQMNLPRFIRQKDKLTLTTNVVNLSENNIASDIILQIIEPKTEKIIYEKTQKGEKINSKQTKIVEWSLPTFPNYDLVIVKVVAVSDKFSDGEQKYLPILPNKVLVTESMPMTVRKNETKTFNINHFIQNWKNVETKNLTVEFSTNPIWYAVQAMPTVSEPKHENAIDYISAYYVNRLANYIVTTNPKIKTVFSEWKQENSKALVSNLSKNQELKNVQLEETPWVLDAQNETEQKQKIATLFDKNIQKNNAERYLDKLFELQTPNGGFSWIKGMPDSRYITQKVLLKLAQIKRITQKPFTTKYERKIEKAIRYLDLKIAEDFTNLKRYNKNYYKHKSIGNTQLLYLYVRSEYKHIPIEKIANSAVNFYTGQAEKYWTDFTLYGQAMMAQVAHKNKNQLISKEIITSLKENAIKSHQKGMYWAKNRAGWFWYERPIAIQSAIIDTWLQTNSNAKDVEEMKIWLLQQKQTQRWSNVQSTIDAIYALLNSGSDWLSESGNTTVSFGNQVLNNNKETATGYFKKQISISDLTTKKENITIKNSDSSLGWGATYWLYFQDADKVKSQGKELHVSKKMFVEKIENRKKMLIPIEKVILQKGDKVITRLVVKTDRNLTFVSLKDLRASCFEPLEQISTIKYREGVRFYQTTKDTSTQFYFEFLPKGTYVFENEMWVNNTGTFTSGITTLQCMYAPEFTAHSKGKKVFVR